MGGIIGRLFREFAMTLSVAIMISLVVSLTTTPMMCAYLLPNRRKQKHGRLYRAGERVFEAVLRLYDRSLRRALQWPALVMLSLVATLGFAIYLFMIVPKGFIPQQDNGLVIGGIQADQSISFQSMQQKLTQFVDVLRQDPAYRIGQRVHRRRPDEFRVCVSRPEAAVRAQSYSCSRSWPGYARSSTRLPALGSSCGRRPTFGSAGAPTTPNTSTLCNPTPREDIYDWAPKIEAALQHLPQLTDVNLDQQQKGLETDLVIDRATAARLGLTVSQIDNTLYDAFGQRQVSTIYAAQNQYHVDHGGGARVLAGPGNPEADLYQHQRRRGQRHAGDPALGRHGGGQGACQEQRRRRHREPNRRQPGAQCSQ